MAQGQQPVIYAASAVVWRQDEVLLVRRGRPPGKDYWSLPGGKIEAGETPEAAALREVREETGLQPELLGLIGVFSISSGDVEYRISCFVARSISGAIQFGDDAADAQWVKLSAVNKLKLAPNTFEAIQQSQDFVKP
jgi:mutator protein MutT